MVVAVQALACELPATTGVPLARWHCPDLARAAVAQGIVASVCGTTIWRWPSAAGQTAAGRLQGQWPTLRLIHLPVHASWLNQVEAYFSVTQRKILTPNDFGSLAEVQAGPPAFQDHYQQIATPFEWKFTKSDLDLLLKRLAAYEPGPALAA